MNLLNFSEAIHINNYVTGLPMSIATRQALFVRNVVDENKRFFYLLLFDN